MYKKSILVLLIALFFKSITWLFVVPIWQSPDEQAHFSQVQYYGEKNTLKIRPPDLSMEVEKSEILLGTKRDNNGNNKFTYHPDYRLEYSDNFYGPFEKAIQSSPVADRKEMVATEAAMYPKTYYLLALPIYKIFYSFGLIDRVFAVRTVSVLCGLLLAVVAYIFGRQIWKEKHKAIALAAVVSFHPMMSFVSAGFHPDNLLNVLYSISILLSLLILKNGLKLKYLLILAAVLYLGIQTKWLMYLVLPLVGAIIAFRLFGHRLGLIIAGVIVIIPAIVIYLGLPLPYIPQVSVTSPLYSMGILEYLHFRLPKVLFETWPWYWLVYKWLGIVFPPMILKVITRIGIICAVGLVVRLCLSLFSKRSTFETKTVIWSIISISSYFVYLILWDYKLMQSSGFSAGIQGRYFFPNIIPQMILFLVGFSTAISLVNKNVGKYSYLLFAIFMVSLNVLALSQISSSYYDISSIKLFIVQVSQYKPVILKGYINIYILVGFLVSSILFLLTLLKLTKNEKANN